MFMTLIIKKSRLKLILGLAMLLLLLLAPLLFDLPNRLAAVVNQSERLLPIYYVHTNEKKVAISFDASWGAERTRKILDTLREFGVKTTFFLTGFWVEDYPEYVKLIAQEGHELGNHTYSHPHLSSLSPEQIREELLRLERMMADLSGQKPSLFRPPFGEYNNEVIRIANELGYKTIQWSVDSLDWQNIGKEELIDRVTGRAHKGAIILFHNNGLYTADALPQIIEYLHKNGYQIVPISELIYHENYYIDPSSGAQIKKE